MLALTNNQLPEKLFSFSLKTAKKNYEIPILPAPSEPGNHIQQCPHEDETYQEPAIKVTGFRS